MDVKSQHIYFADKLLVKVFPNREEMGRTAGEEIAAKLKELLVQQSEIRIIFAAAPSQNEVLSWLANDSAIDWSKITVFHMDEYIGLDAEAPQAFSRFLRDRLFDSVKPKQVHLIDSTNNAEQECVRYSALLSEKPIDIVCLGIGENGHIAFNDPPVADFNDQYVIKAVKLDETCRQQQVNDGCFPEIGEVPQYALTLTIPALMSGRYLYCSVPGPTKYSAVQKTIHEPISTACPSTILRQHDQCIMYVDYASHGREGL